MVLLDIETYSRREEDIALAQCISQLGQKPPPASGADNFDMEEIGQRILAALTSEKSPEQAKSKPAKKTVNKQIKPKKKLPSKKPKPKGRK